MRFTVEGMCCSRCVQRITNAIQALEPDAKINADLDARQVEIDSSLDEDQAASAIALCGYGVIAADEPAALTGTVVDCCGVCEC